MRVGFISKAMKIKNNGKNFLKDFIERNRNKRTHKLTSHEPRIRHRTILHNAWFNEESSRNLKSILIKLKWKHNLTKFVWYHRSTVQSKFITLSAYTRKEESYQVNNLNFHFRKLEEKQTKFKISRGKEIIKIRIKSIELKQENQ